MDSEYSIFECLPHGSVSWRDAASGLITARRKLRELVAATGNEFFGIQLSTREIIFPVDAPAIAKRVFQIAYTEALRKARAELLRKRGFGVLSVIGNDAAKTLLITIQLRAEDIAFFIVGHAAPRPEREEIVDWLRLRYPNTKILVLNPPDQQTAGADYNVLQNGPEIWLPIVTSAAA